MQSNVIDIIIYLVKSIHIGTRLKDIKLDTLRGYNNSEISAAYSWLMQKHETGEMTNNQIVINSVTGPRVLHPSERSLISPEAYGYMLELYFLGILDAARFERIIEYSLLRHDGSITSIEDVKEWVAGMIFNSEFPGTDHSMHLKGNERIN